MQQLGSLAAQCASESTLLWREQRGLSSSFVVHAAIRTTQACRKRGFRGPLHPQLVNQEELDYAHHITPLDFLIFLRPYERL